MNEKREPTLAEMIEWAEREQEKWQALMLWCQRVVEKAESSLKEAREQGNG